MRSWGLKKNHIVICNFYKFFEHLELVEIDLKKCKLISQLSGNK